MDDTVMLTQAHLLNVMFGIFRARAARRVPIQK